MVTKFTEKVALNCSSSSSYFHPLRNKQYNSPHSKCNILNFARKMITAVTFLKLCSVNQMSELSSSPNDRPNLILNRLNTPAGQCPSVPNWTNQPVEHQKLKSQSSQRPDFWYLGPSFNQKEY